MELLYQQKSDWRCSKVDGLVGVGVSPQIGRVVELSCIIDRSQIGHVIKWSCINRSQIRGAVKWSFFNVVLTEV